jgi:hypothetical protein
MSIDSRYISNNVEGWMDRLNGWIDRSMKTSILTFKLNAFLTRKST